MERDSIIDVSPAEEKGDKSRCYICLEITKEKSPCECGIALHKECFEKMLENMPNAQCTVCKTDLIGVDQQNVSDNDVEDILEQYDSLDQFLLTFLLLVYILIMYILLGWTGKLVFMIWGYETDDFFSFWTADHLLATAAVCVITFVTNHFIRCDNSAIRLDRQLSEIAPDDGTT